MENRSNQILVGSIVMLLIIILIVFTIWLVRLSGSSDNEYDIYFSQSVDGLASGSGVTYSGVPIGQIDQIALVPNNPEFVRVRIRVDSDVPILEGTTAGIEGIGFTGVSQISLNGGVQGADPIDEPGPAGVPVIPTRPGAFGELLNSAPRLLERLSTLTERLTELLGDRNQDSIAAILDNTRRLTDELAARGDDIAETMVEARIAIRQAGQASEEIGQLANTTDSLLASDGRALVADLRNTVAAAESSMTALERTVSAAEPGLNQFSERTIPEVGQLVRDMRGMTQALTEISERLNRDGAGSLVGSQRLPDYEPQ
ncbi:MAG: MCE family protein [Sphingomonadaceae bacterium]|nr:MCE family protein [Sphingomonadaceae bacterium]